ncbi:MAG: hypothetical protein ACM3N4_04420 [Nitrososphaerota archaeon]
MGNEQPRATARPGSERGATPVGLRPQFLLETLAALAIGVAFLGLPQILTVGPNWLALAISVAVLAPLFLMAFVHPLHHQVTRMLRAGLQVVLTAALLSSVGLLVTHLSDANLKTAIGAGGLLRAGALLWISNILIFAVWYWEIDGDGPVHRHQRGHPAIDFLFPQQASGRPFAPGFVDYLFLAFCFATALSPADTAPLTRRAKLLMMAEALISITIIALLVARSVNIL